jgi:hypothetical protein
MPRYVRVYRCPDCGHKWKTESTLGFLEPCCPNCGFEPDPLPERISAPAIIGTRAKAVDLAYNIAAEDFGLTNLNDSTREGDIAFKAPAAPPANIIGPQNAVAAAGGMMWGGGGKGRGKTQPAPVPSMNTVRSAAALQNAEGTNPMRILHRSKPTLNAHSLGRFNRR